jgi:hypothetical protein
MGRFLGIRAMATALVVTTTLWVAKQRHDTPRPSIGRRLSEPRGGADDLRAETAPNPPTQISLRSAV